MTKLERGDRADGEGGGEICGSADVFVFSDVASSKDGIGGTSIVAWMGDTGLLARSEGWILYAGRSGSRGVKSSFCRGDSGRGRTLSTLVWDEP